MRVVTVESSTLAVVAYDETRDLLQLQFRNRAIYQYLNVPAAVHQALLDAPSKGRYFNDAIRGRFPYSPVPDFAIVEPDTEIPAGCDR